MPCIDSDLTFSTSTSPGRPKFTCESEEPAEHEKPSMCRTFGVPQHCRYIAYAAPNRVYWNVNHIAKENRMSATLDKL